MADVSKPTTANGVSPEEAGLKPPVSNPPAAAVPKSNGSKSPFDNLGYPTITDELEKGFNKIRDGLAAQDKGLANLDCVRQINRKTDEAYAVVFSAFQNLSAILDKNTNERTRKLNRDRVRFYFTIPPEKTDEVLNKIILVANKILTGEAGLKSSKTTYDFSFKITGLFGYANTPAHSDTTNLSEEAVKDLIDNKEGYFIHAIIHETIHRVTDFGREFNAFDIYDSDPKFDSLTLDEQLKNPDSYTNLFIQLS